MSQISSCQVLGAELGVGDATVGKGNDVPTVLHAACVDLIRETDKKKTCKLILQRDSHGLG